MTDASEKNIELLQGILRKYLEYNPTEEERDLWFDEKETLISDILTEKDGLQLLYKRIKARADIENAKFSSRKNAEI